MPVVTHIYQLASQVPGRFFSDKFLSIGTGDCELQACFFQLIKYLESILVHSTLVTRDPWTAVCKPLVQPGTSGEKNMALQEEKPQGGNLSPHFYWQNKAVAKKIADSNCVKLQRRLVTSCIFQSHSNIRFDAEFSLLNAFPFSMKSSVLRSCHCRLLFAGFSILCHQIGSRCCLLGC